MMKQLVTLVTLTATAAIAHAQPDEASPLPASREPRHSLNLDPVGALFGAFDVNYELLTGSHGVVVEGSFAHQGGDDASVTSYGGGAGYRWHWRGRQNSGFLGLMVGFAGGTAEATVGADMPERFDITLKQLSVTMNIGKRWQLANGINITGRLGGGRAVRWFSTSSMDPDAQQAVEDVEDVMDLIPIAVDGELSLGYSF